MEIYACEGIHHKKSKTIPEHFPTPEIDKAKLNLLGFDFSIHFFTLPQAVEIFPLLNLKLR